MDKLVGKVSKESKSSARNSKINTFLNTVAKEQKIGIKKGSSISTKISDIKKGSKVLPIGVKSV